MNYVASNPSTSPSCPLPRAHCASPALCSLDRALTDLLLFIDCTDEERGPKAKRPYLATECHDLLEADRWRQQVIRDIGRRVMEIQNAGLGEHK